MHNSKLHKLNIGTNKIFKIKTILIIGTVLLSFCISIIQRNHILINIQADEQQSLQVFYSENDGHKEEASKWIDVPVGSTAADIKILNSNINYIRIDLEKNKSIKIESVEFSGAYLESSCNYHNYYVNQASVIRDGKAVRIIGKVDQVDPYISTHCISYFSAKRAFGTLSLFLTLSILGILIIYFLFKIKTIFSKICSKEFDLNKLSKYSLSIKLLIGFGLILVFTLISSNQVVFNKKSFIAPLGTSLIYSDNPSLPDYKYDRIYDYHGSDTGATMWQHIPYTFLAGNAITKDHQIPLWNRFNGGGRSLVGQGQAMIFEPINLLIALTGFESWKYDLKYIILKFIFAISIALILYILKCSFLTSVLLGVLSIFSSFYFFRLNHPGYFTYAYSPILILSYLCFIVSKSKIQELLSIIFLIISNFILLNSGTGKEAYLSIILFNLLGFLLMYSYKLKLKSYIKVFFSCFIFAAISAPIWFSFLDYIASQKSGYSSPAAVQFNPSDFIFYSENLGFLSIGGYNPAINFPIFYLFIISFIIFIREVNFRDRINCVLIYFTSVLLCISYGLFPAYIIKSIPFLNSVHHVNDVFSSIAIVPTIILAGISLNYILENSLKRFEKYSLILISIFLLTIPIIFSDISSKKYLLIFIILYLVSLFAFFYFIKILFNFVKTKIISLKNILILTSIIFLFVVRSIQFPDNDLGVFKNLVFVPSPTANLHPDLKILKDYSKLTEDLPTRAIGIEGTMFSGYRAIYGIESVDGPDALFPKYFRLLSEELELPYDWYWRMRFNNANIITNKNALDFLNVGYIFSENQTFNIGKKIAEDGKLSIIKRDNPWPRSFFTSCFDVLDEAESLKLVASNLKNSNKTFLILDNKSFANSGVDLKSNCFDSKIIIPNSFIKSSNESIIHITTNRPGVLYLGENFEENNFKVYVDGVESKVIRANFAFKSVFIANSGPHIVSFVYSPPSFVNLLKVSYFGLVLLLFMIIIYLKSYFSKSKVITKSF